MTLKTISLAILAGLFLAGCAAPHAPAMNYGHPALNAIGSAPPTASASPGQTALAVVTGGVIGSQFGRGEGRVAGAALGAATGAMMAQGEVRGDAVAGALLGGLVGSRLGRGEGRVAGAALGAGLGAMLAVPRE